MQAAPSNPSASSAAKPAEAAEVAKDLEKQKLKRGQEMLTSSVAQAATESDSNPAEASPPKFAKTDASLDKPISMQAAPSNASPARGDLDSFASLSHSANLTLPELRSRLEGNSSEPCVQVLLQQITTLEKWQGARTPSNEVRNAMLKLGTHFGVPRQEKGKKRPPSEVAQ